MISSFSLPAAMLAVTFLTLGTPAVFSQSLQPAPQLQVGETLFYQIDLHSSRNLKAESRVVSSQSPSTENFSASGLLQVEIQEVTAAGLRIKTYYSERNPSPGLPPSSASALPSPDKAIEVFVASDGTASQIKGLERLSGAQQFAWNSWLARFTSSMAFPKTGVRINQRWQSSEPETTPSPIAALVWSRKYQYVRDEPCSVQSTSQFCAVILVRAVLQQKSPEKNATPEEYKLRNLKTRGTAAGENETILYISRRSGLLVRSTEDAQQAMDAVVALTDGSNEVRYKLDAKSHYEIRLLPDSTSDVR